MTFKDKYGNTALVAGASEGLGAAYAHALAARGLSLVLVARRKKLLEETAVQIEKQHGVKVQAVVCDLADADAVDKIQAAIGDTHISFLVYNAALSYIGPFLSTGAATHTNIAKVNMVTQLTVLHHFGGKMAEQRKGGIVIMTSIAGLQGSGYLSTYAATKAFNRVLAEGLWYEWKPKGIDVIACCAGAIATPNYINTNPAKASAMQPKEQLPEEVVEECLRKIGRTPFFISGTGNKLVSFLMQHIFNRKQAVNMMGASMKKVYGIVDAV
jgi:short-subunit dehydrogenase